MRGRLADLGLLAVGLAAAGHAAGVHGLRRHGAPGDGLFPFVAAAGLVLFVALGLIVDRTRRCPSVAAAGGGMAALVTALLGLYAAALPHAGYPLATAVLLVVVAKLANPRLGWTRAVSVAVVLAAATFLLFARGLGVPLPLGRLG